MLKVRWKTFTRSNVRSVKSSTPMHSFIGISEAIKWGRCEIDELTSIILKRCCCTSHGSIGVSCESLKTVRASTSSYRSVRKGVEKSVAWSETVRLYDLITECPTHTNSKNTNRFMYTFEDYKVFTNDENTRSFGSIMISEGKTEVGSRIET